jgi:cyclopropane-fatty-acyl-phospholipid synthase
MFGHRRLARLLATLVNRGQLTVHIPGFAPLVLGDGSLPHVAVRFTDRRAVAALMWDPELKLGELFMDGRLVVEDGTFLDLLQVLLQDNGGARTIMPGKLLTQLRRILFPFLATNPAGRSRRNVAHHYDLDGRLYDLFLDADKQYSCAYFETPDATLEQAQLAKKRHIAAKLAVRPGDRVLDIGSGWGGLALYLAEIARAGQVNGVTLSEEQLALSRARAAAKGLDARVRFDLTDYRTVQGQFDRIVSVGMFEHVGVRDYPAYFGTASRLMTEDGVMLLHFIGRTGEPDFTNPWITKYIFPGGHLPTLSEIMPAVEKSGLAITDIEVLRLHYAETLKAWRERFLARRAEALELYDERFCRMWEAYLSMSESAFRWQDVVIFQIQITKKNTVLPLTRDYIVQAETRLRRAEAAAAAAGQACNDVGQAPVPGERRAEVSAEPQPDLQRQGAAE